MAYIADLVRKATKQHKVSRLQTRSSNSKQSNAYALILEEKLLCSGAIKQILPQVYLHKKKKKIALQSAKSMKGL